jgi:hypothetical protein
MVYGRKDRVVDKAKEDLCDLFTDYRREAFFMKQLEVGLEKTYFHWVTVNAINQLLEGELRAEKYPLTQDTQIKFVFHRKLRYHRRVAARKLKIVQEYSAPKMTRAYGKQAEVLFFTAFMDKGFRSYGRNTNEYNGKKWTKTAEDLDFIIGTQGTVYGVEVKNRFDYIRAEELNSKLNMCDYLGIKPLFIMRYAPKTYIHRINKRGGFALLFKTQIYPLGFERLVERINGELGLPVVCTGAIPESTMQRFMMWHNREKNM